MTPVLLQALKDKPMIVTCMDVDGYSWYLASPYPQMIARGNDTTKVKSLFTTFFFDEFIPCLDQNYRINPKQRMLTGNSMGGFGAFHYMLTKPERFISVSSLSGLFEKTDADKKWMPLLGSIEDFPDRHRNVDVFQRVQKAGQQGVQLPAIYMICGTEDPLLPHNRAMQRLLKEQGIAFEYQESAGKHGWPFWSEKLPGVIDFHWRSVQQSERPAKERTE
jgi:putative tributyrin esterase